MFRWIRSLWNQPWQPGFMAVLVIINLLGSIYGYYWYRNQLPETPLYFWPLVPDSPLSTTLFALALAFALLGWRLYGLQTVAQTVCIKYGIWAVALISHYWILGGEVRWTEVMLWLSHVGMAAQGMWFLRKQTVTLKAAVLAIAWITLNDVADYLLNLHPYFFATNQFNFAAIIAVVLTLTLTLTLLNKARSRRVFL